jgi:hypothetical protein
MDAAPSCPPTSLTSCCVLQGVQQPQHTLMSFPVTCLHAATNSLTDTGLPLWGAASTAWAPHIHEIITLSEPHAT